MPSFSDYWTSLQQKNPSLDNPHSKMTLTVGAFRAAVERAYNRGDLDRFEAQEAVENLKPKGAGFGDLFGDLFK